MRLAGSVGVGVSVLGLCGCGAAATKGVTPTQEAGSPTRAEGAADAKQGLPQDSRQPGYGQSEFKTKEPHADYAAPPPAVTGAEDSASLPSLALLDELRKGEVALSAAGHDCEAACKALRSMQRAAARLCSIAMTEEERERCQAAEQRVRTARERVRSSCSQCSGGPSLAPEAPIGGP